MLGREKVVYAIQKGILEANQRYEQWSGGQWITDYDVGVEPVMTVSVAGRLHKAFQQAGSKDYLTMEATFSSIEGLSKAKKKPGPYPEGWTKGRKVDVAIWGSTGKPRAVIEIKRSWQARVLDDVDKIIHLLKRSGQTRGGSLQYGVVAFGVASSDGERSRDIETRLADYQRKIGEYVDGKASAVFYDSKKIQWQSGAAGEPLWRSSAMCAVISLP